MVKAWHTRLTHARPTLKLELRFYLLLAVPRCSQGDPPLLLQADPQDFEQMLMEEPLLTVRDFRAGLSDEVADAGELLRNYEFNISQGIVQRVSRFFDALALMDEHGAAPPAHGEGGEGGEDADSARGGVKTLGFGHKRNVFNLEKKPARRVTWEQ